MSRYDFTALLERAAGMDGVEEIGLGIQTNNPNHLHNEVLRAMNEARPKYDALMVCLTSQEGWVFLVLKSVELDP